MADSADALDQETKELIQKFHREMKMHLALGDLKHSPQALNDLDKHLSDNYGEDDTVYPELELIKAFSAEPGSEIVAEKTIEVVLMSISWRDST